MKILHVATDRRAAQRAANALRALAPDVTLAWAGAIPPAMRWLQQHPDAVAVVLEPEVRGQSCGPLVEHVRRLGLGAALVVVAPEGSAAALPVDHRVAVVEELPAVLARVLPRAALGSSSPVPQAPQSGAVPNAGSGAGSPQVQDAAASARHVECERRFAEEAARRTTLETALAAAEAARREAESRHAAELSAASARLAESQARHDTALARAGRICRGLEERALELEAALRQAEQQRASEAATSVELLARRHAEFTDSLARAAQARDAVVRQLSEAQAALDDTARLRAADAASAAMRLAEREAELGGRLAEAAAARAALEAALDEIRRALQQSQADAVAQRARFEDETARRESAHQEQLASEAAVRATLESELNAVREALDESRQARADMEGALLELEAAHQQAAAQLGTAGDRIRALESELDRSIGTSQALARELDGMRSGVARTRRRFLQVASAFRLRARENETRLKTQLHDERAALEGAIATRDDQIRQLQQHRDALQERTAAMLDEMDALRASLEAEREGAERLHLAHETEVRRLSADYEQATASLAQVRTAFSALEQVSSGHAAERARLERVVAERDAQLNAQAAAARAAEDAARAALAEVRQHLDQTVERTGREIARYREELNGRRQELERAHEQIGALQREAERVPALLAQLREQGREYERQFGRAPWGLCRCDASGALVHANAALVRLLGYRSSDELRAIDFARTVFESAGDLHWMMERAGASGTTDWAQATWRRKDGRRIIVRLQLHARSDGTVDVIVEDVTTLRTVEDKLRRAQRLEAVGRVASEVAATCDSLLRDVSEDGRQLLAAIEDGELRRQIDQIFGDVTRATGFLRQLAIYGDTEVNALRPTSVQGILRDLQPVLKRIAGEEIDLVLPKGPAGPELEVDVEAENVERVLVNVARYARERMPQGGRVQITLGTTVADSRLVARHPNVRPGAHVVITATGVGRADGGAAPEGRTGPDTSEAAKPARKPGVDLGALLQLIGACGGHLWMSAERAGNMTLKIHLPQVVAEGVLAGAPVPRAAQGRSLARWFRH